MRRPPIALLLVCAAALAAALAGCGSSDDDARTGAATNGTPAPDPSALDGRDFVARRVEGRRLVAGSALTLSFEDGRLGARGGCNLLGAGYALADGRLRLQGEPQSTMIGCEPALMRQDDWLRAFLDAAPAVTLAGDRLTLRDGDVTIELTEGASAATPPPLVGTTWRLETIGERGGTASSVPAGVERPTLRLTGDGRAELFAGCNRGSAGATVRDDGFVVFGPFALTRKACADPAAADVESVVTAILDGTVAAGFEGTRLTLAKSGRHLTFTAG